MNKKGIVELIGTILFVVILGLMIFVLVKLAIYGINEKKLYDSYKEFCENNEDICYCNKGFVGECKFKTSQSKICVNNNCSNLELSESSKKLCNLAEELNDKELIFEIC